MDIKKRMLVSLHISQLNGNGPGASNLELRGIGMGCFGASMKRGQCGCYL